MKSYQEKREKLLQHMEQLAAHDVVIAFSGGVDSSLLVKIACEKAKAFGTKVYAVTIHTMLHPMGELELTKRVAEEMGAIHRVIEVDELSKAGISDNPIDRCYRCKHYMFTKLLLEAEDLAVQAVLEGTNEDDTKAYRPGLRALGELGVISPLLEAGFTKADVRSYAQELGISVANRPSMPCLATRFPYGTKLSYEEMKKVDAIEVELRARGFYNVRARIHGELVRLEVDEASVETLTKNRRELVAFIRQLGYSYVAVDLEGFRSGSQDLHIHPESAHRK